MKKSTRKTVIIVAVAMLAVVILGSVTSGFQKWGIDDIKNSLTADVNPDNYYTVDCMSLVDTDEGYGVYIDVDEDTGAIVLDGKAQQDITATVGTVHLKPGEYTLTSLKGASRSSVYLTLSGNSINADFDFKPANTISITTEGDYTITLKIADEAEFKNVTILPVIVEGDTAGSFWDK